MTADSIAQIAKALARLVLVVSPPFVTLKFHSGMVKNSTFSNCLVTPAPECGSLARLFITKLSSHMDALFCLFLSCSITSVADSLQQCPWAPYQRTPSSPSSSLSGGNNSEDVCTSCTETGCAIANVCYDHLEKYSVNSSAALCADSNNVKYVLMSLCGVCLCTGLASG